LYLSVTPDQIMSQFRAIDGDVLNEVSARVRVRVRDVGIGLG